MRRVLNSVAVMVVLVVLVVAAAGCDRTPTTPSPPPPPQVGPATPPVIRSITVNTGGTGRTEVEQDVTVTAVVEDAETPLTSLTYVWSATSGTITGSGATVTWRHVAGLQQGVDVVITLTVVDTYQAVENNQIVNREYRVVEQAAPFRVHDSVAELKELARRFLIDLFGNSSIPPEGCLADFSEVGRCAQGKSHEYDDIVLNRQLVVIESAEVIAQAVDFDNAESAIVTTEAIFHDRWIVPPPGESAQHSTHADFYLSAIYDQGRWWLCESTFGNIRGRSLFLEALRALHGDGRFGGRLPIRK